MIGLRTFLLSLMAGLMTGAPISDAAFVNTDTGSSIDAARSNVFYDLACLYGDEVEYGGNGDGALSDSEYASFDINLLAPESDDLLTDFSPLGFLPDSDDIYFYAFHKLPFTTLSGGRQVSLGYSFSLSYENGIEISEDGSSYLDNATKVSSLTLINTYHGNSGYFTKFQIDDFVFNYDDGTMRVKPLSFSARNSAGVRILSCNFENTGSDAYEFWYKDSDSYQNIVSSFFDRDTYEIEGVVDGYLTSAEQYTRGGFFIFSPSYGTNITKMYENYFFFFSFSDSSFSVDDIETISYRYELVTYNAVDYGSFYYDTSGNKTGDVTNFQTVYQGKNGQTANADASRSDFSELHVTTLTHNLSNTYYNGYTETVSRESVSDTTSAADTEQVDLVQTDYMQSLFNHKAIKRASSFKGIVDMSKIDETFPDDEVLETTDGTESSWAFFKNFLKQDDHTSYDWAFALSPDTYSREITSTTQQSFYDDYPFLTGQTSAELVTVTSQCHDLEEVVVLTMSVVVDGVGQDIKVWNNPQSVRKYYAYGYEAPSLLAFYINDIVNLEWYVWLIIALVVLVAIIVLCVMFPYVWTVVSFILKGIVEILYIVLIWWWLATLKKATGGEIPPLWLFD